MSRIAPNVWLRRRNWLWLNGNEPDAIVGKILHPAQYADYRYCTLELRLYRAKYVPLGLELRIGTIQIHAVST